MPLRSSELKGSMPDTITPMMSVRWLRMLRAMRLDSYPSSSMARRTRAAVAMATP